MNDWPRANAFIVLRKCKWLVTWESMSSSDVYESTTKLFLCYQVVTALTERFCQNAFAPREAMAEWMNFGLSVDLIGCYLLGSGEVWKKDGRTSHAAVGF